MTTMTRVRTFAIRRLRVLLMVCAAVVLLSSITTLAIASHRIVAEQSAFFGPRLGPVRSRTR